MNSLRGISVVDVENGLYIMKFDSMNDKEKDISGRALDIFDHDLAIRPWVSNFVSLNVKIDRTLVWIHFTSLGMEYYNETVFLTLTSSMGIGRQ